MEDKGEKQRVWKGEKEGRNRVMLSEGNKGVKTGEKKRKTNKT